MKFKPLPIIIASLAAASAIQAQDQYADNLNVAIDATVNGTLTVQPALTTETSNTPTTTGAGATNPDAGNFGAAAAGATKIITVLGGVDAASTTTTGGGAEIKNNGDVTLNSATGTTTTGSYTRLTTVDVYDADQGELAGTPVPGSQKYYAAYPDPANPGQYISLQEFDTLADLDAFVANTPITDPVFAPLNPQTTPLDNTGGNLTVGGDASIAGQTTTNGINNSGQKITGLADGTAATDAVNKGQLDAAAAALAAVDATEAATRASEDTSIRNEFRLADTNIIKDYTDKISAETAARVIADDQIRGEFRSADKALRHDIDRNTRGIAMVAAMTNTTVEAGKTHGVDFNVAQFQESTGFSFGYANRINDNVQLRAAMASSEDFEEAVGRVGVSIQW